MLLRRSDGFGLVELMIALAILVVGVLATFGLFESGLVQLGRATTISTATAVGEQQIEDYRAVRFDAIGFTPGQLTGLDSTYVGDPAYRAPGTNQAEQAVTITSSTFSPSQTVTGADGESYRVDAFVSWQAVTDGRNVKIVTVVVRDADNVTRVLTRVVSSFDVSTGL